MSGPTLALDAWERAVLVLVRISDEDHGGLRAGELRGDELEPLARLCDRGLVEAIGEYGEAPDGEVDEIEASAAEPVYRITGRGVEALAELRDRGEL